MQASVQIRYSVAFKRQVVADLEAGRFRSIEQVRQHYGIGGSMTVRRWLELFGKNHLIPKVVRVEKPNEACRIRQLQQEIHQLKQALGETQLRNVLNESYLEIACEQLGQEVESFKKKPSRSGPSGRRDGGRIGSGLVPDGWDVASELLQAASSASASPGG